MPVRRKRKRAHATREAVRRQLALDADALAGQIDHLNKSATYVIERVAGPLAGWSALARQSCDMSVVFGSCTYPGDPSAPVGSADREPGHSLLVFNKLYGQTLDVPVRQSGEREAMHMFSAFFPRRHTERKDPREWVYEQLYGGWTDRGEGAEPRYVPRPAVFDQLTQTLMYEASIDFGWRALLYESTGADDPYPTGIVALEAFLFRRVPRTETTAAGKRLELTDVVDEHDLERYAERVRAVMAIAPRLVSTREEQRRAARAAPATKVAAVPPEVRAQMDANAAHEAPEVHAQMAASAASEEPADAEMNEVD